MAKHTPAPWDWYWRQEDGEAVCGVFHESRPGMAYSVCRAPRYQTRQQWEADARLISAAPDLYDAADNALNALIACCVPAGGVDDRKAILDAQAMLRAAIAKATGSAQ